MDETDLTIEEVFSAEVMVKQVSRVFRYSRNGKQGQISITMPPEFWLEPRWVWEPVVRQAILTRAQNEARPENGKENMQFVAWIRGGRDPLPQADGGYLIPPRVRTKKRGLIAWILRLFGDERGYKWVDSHERFSTKKAKG